MKQVFCAYYSRHQMFKLYRENISTVIHREFIEAIDT